MTDLQISLVGIGIAIVVGVLAYNKWQDYRAKKHVQQAFPQPVEDVLMNTGQADNGTERREPVLDSPLDSGDVENVEEVSANEPNLQEDVENKAEVLADSVAVAKVIEIPVDDLIELPITLNLEESLRGEKILPHIQSLRHIGNKPVRFIGMTDGDDDSAKSWQAIVPGNSYRHLKACVLLANRNGALNEIEFSELLMRLRQISDAIGAEPDIPEMADVIDKAKHLYQFVADHDAKLGISIRSNGSPWQMVTLSAALEKQGFESRSDGQFVMKDKENGSVLFSLLTNEFPAAETATRLTLLMDVPCIALEKDGFAQMVQYAKALCIRLDGTLIDDGNQLLTDEFLEEIAGQVRNFCKEMEDFSIPAGSARALRLFN